VDTGSRQENVERQSGAGFWFNPDRNALEIGLPAGRFLPQLCAGSGVREAFAASTVLAANLAPGLRSSAGRCNL